MPYPQATDTKQFYPTPENLARKMRYKLTGLDRKKTVLDPSAGTGALLESFSSYDPPEFYAIEIDPERAYTLRGKGYRVIGSDFMAYDEPMKFDAVIMNPPFRNGVKHVLKAWELVVDGGQMVALLPTTALDKDKVLASLIAQHGEVTNEGRAFIDAERAAQVEVSIIYLKKPETAFDFGFDGVKFGMDEVQEKGFSENPLAHTSLIDNLVARYKGAEQALINRDLEQKRLNFYLGKISLTSHEDVDRRDAESALSPSANLRQQILLLKNAFWQLVFRKSKIAQKATSDFREKFGQFAKDQAYMEFSKPNIVAMLTLFFENKEQIMKQSIVKAFDDATAHHEKNIVHKEGWKTNKSYRVNKRIIVPYGVDYDDRFDWSRFSSRYHRRDFYQDLDKVLCWLSGIEYGGENFISTHEAIDAQCRAVNAGEAHYQDWFESTHFRLRMYKKGTVWLDFKDMYLLDDFNQAAAEGKNWIGGGY